METGWARVLLVTLTISGGISCAPTAKYYSSVDAQRDALDGRISGADDDPMFIAAAMPALASPDYNIAHQAFANLVERFQNSPDQALVEAFEQAGNMLTILTDYYADGDHPTGLLNFSCFVMPPPVDPYPVPRAWAKAQRHYELPPRLTK